MSYTGDGGGDPAWVLAVLAGIGATANGYNDVALKFWAQSEGMPDYANNWLATERAGFGGTTYNAAGVFAYPTLTAGVAATVATLKQSNFDGIRTALVQARSLSFIYDAINQSQWCGGCQDGKYPVALFDYISGLVGGATVTPTGIGRPVQEPTTPPGFDWSATIHETAKTFGDRAGSLSGYAAAIANL